MHAQKNRFGRKLFGGLGLEIQKKIPGNDKPACLYAKIAAKTGGGCGAGGFGDLGGVLEQHTRSIASLGWVHKPGRPCGLPTTWDTYFSRCAISFRLYLRPHTQPRRRVPHTGDRHTAW